MVFSKYLITKKGPTFVSNCKVLSPTVPLLLIKNAANKIETKFPRISGRLRLRVASERKKGGGGVGKTEVNYPVSSVGVCKPKIKLEEQRIPGTEQGHAGWNCK